jgi:hypothetical protein
MEKSTPCANLKISGCEGLVVTRGTVLCEKCSQNRLNAIRNRKDADDNISSIKTATLFSKITELEKKLEFANNRITELEKDNEVLNNDNSRLSLELHEAKNNVEILLKEKRVLSDSIKDEIRKAKIEASEEHGSLSLRSRLSELKIEEMKELYEAKILEWENAYNNLERKYKNFCDSIEPHHTNLINSIEKELSNNTQEIISYDNRSIQTENGNEEDKEIVREVQSAERHIIAVSQKNAKRRSTNEQTNIVVNREPTETEETEETELTETEPTDHTSVKSYDTISNTSSTVSAPREIKVVKPASNQNTPRKLPKSISLTRQNTPSDNLKEFKNSVEKNAPNENDTVSEIEKKKKKKLTVGVAKSVVSSVDKSKKNNIVQIKRKEA